MAQSEAFRRLLTEGIYRISVCEGGKPIRVVQDELGYVLDKRGGGSAVEYWRQGHLPKMDDIEKLARALVRRSDLDQAWLMQFLTSARYPHPAALCQELFPQPPPPLAPAPQRDDPTDTERHAAPAPTPVRAPEHLLPNKTYRALVGRAAWLAAGLAALQDSQGRWVVAIDGIGGIGKTALARELVALCQKKRLFDAVIWLSAAGRVPWPDAPSNGALTFATLLDTVARYLGAPNLTDPAEKLMRVHLWLRSQRVLLVLDNLETAAEPQATLIAQLQALLNPSKVLCTSRHRFTGDVYAIHLDGLAAEAAAQLVRQTAQARAVLRLTAAPDDVITQIATTTGGSPLAIKLVVGQAGHLPLPVILQALTAVRPLSTLANGEVDFYQALFWPAWNLLSATARALLVALTLFEPGEGGGLAAIHVISGLAEDALIQGINQLWQLSLLEVAESTTQPETEALRYFLHPLTYHFVVSAIRQLEQPPTPPEANPAPTQDTNQQPGVGADDTVYWHGCLERALHYLRGEITRYAPAPPPELERRLAMHVLNKALMAPALWSLTSQVLIELAPKMEQAGHRHDWLPYLEQALVQSQPLGDAGATAELHLNAGMLYQLLGEYPTAATHFAAAATYFADSGDLRNQARALNRWAYVARLQHEPVEATRLAQTALTQLAETDAERGSSYTVLGAIALDAQDGGQAVEYFRQALACWQPTGNVPMIARRLRDLGAALRQTDNYTEAIACYEQALLLFAQVQEPSQQAVVQMNLGNVYLRLGQPEQALALYRLAEPIFQKTCDEPQLTMLYHNLAEANAALPPLEQAKTPTPAQRDSSQMRKENKRSG